MFAREEWEDIIDAAIDRTAAGELRWYADPEEQEGDATSYISHPGYDMRFHLVPTDGGPRIYEFFVSHEVNGTDFYSACVSNTEVPKSVPELRFDDLYRLAESQAKMPSTTFEQFMKDDFYSGIMSRLGPSMGLGGESKG